MLAILDYKAGNLTSVRLAFESLGCAAQITSDPEVVRTADHVIFPGVGAAAYAMANLEASGLRPVIDEVVARGTPFLGICLGTQILFESSEEDGGTKCLGLIPGKCVRFQPADQRVKVPHMGWNQVAQSRPHPLFKGIADNSDFYFVHSFYTAPADESVVIGRTDYVGVSFVSAVARGNLAATQFHPEKSGRVGLKLLSNFLEWDGTEQSAKEGAPC